MRLGKINLLLVLGIFATVSCVEPYDPPAIAEADSYLVVEGFINASGPTTIKLTRTSRLRDEGTNITEDNAIITVESEEGEIAQLYQEQNGTYFIESLNISFDKQYRIRITTTNDHEYLSEFVPVKQAPPIDNVYYELDPQGLGIFLNTFDNLNSTQYYRWDYEETWEFNSKYNSELIYKDGFVVDRDPSEQINICWQSNESDRILTTSTVRLSRDNVHRFPLVYFNKPDWKLSRKYSILVKQYPLTKEGYEFYELLKSNSEELGSFFDPQPSQLRGNIYSTTNSDQLVVGFVSAGTSTQKRLFINNNELDEWHEDVKCETFEVTSDSVQYYFEKGIFIPINSEMVVGGGVFYLASTRSCTDCTTRGTTVKPLFWQ